MDKFLTHLFGNEVIIVTATRLHAFHKFEKQFIFHRSCPLNLIRQTLRTKEDYSVNSHKKYRTTKYVSPQEGKYRAITKEKCLRSFD